MPPEVCCRLAKRLKHGTGAVLGLISAAAVLVASPSVASSGATTVTPAATTSSSSKVPPSGRQSVVRMSLEDQTVESIVANGPKLYPDAFGGVAYGQNGEGIEVYLSSLDPAVEAGLRSMNVSSVPVKFFKVANPSHVIRAIHSALERDWRRWEARGIRLGGFYPDVRTGLEDIGVIGLTDRQKATLEDYYGREKVHVHAVPASVMTLSPGRVHMPKGRSPR